MMRGLSLWQPWGSMMYHGMKRNETRSWKTDYRGDILICSALRKPNLVECGDRVTFDEALKLPYGMALCVVELYDCVPTQNFMRRADKALLPLRTITEQEWDCGNYARGRWAWMTRNLRPIKSPVSWKGKQGLWTLTDEEEAKIIILIAGICKGCGFKISKDSDYCGECICEEDGI